MGIEFSFYTHTEDIKYHDIGNGWTLATVSAWKNSVNATVGGVGMLIGPRALKTLNSIERIQPRMMAATFNGNLKATIISCYSPTNISEETELVAFYDELSSLVHSILKHNVLVIGRDMNAQIRKNGKDRLCLYKQEMENSSMNCKAYSSFEDVSSDHRIVTAKIQLSLRKNATRTVTTKHYDWALLNNRDIRDKYVLELRNRFEALQEETEKGTPNDEYENSINAHLKAAAKCIPTKPRTKYRVSWETLAVREKHAHVKTASKSYRKNPTNTNALKLKKAQNQLAGIYLKEQTDYIQNQIDKIRDSVEDRQTINEMSRRKSTAKAKLKATNQQERIKL